MNWSKYIEQLRDLCTALDLFNPETFDWGHPVFDAIFRACPTMSKADHFFCQNVIGFYRELIDVAQWEVA